MQLICAKPSTFISLIPPRYSRSSVVLWPYFPVEEAEAQKDRLCIEDMGVPGRRPLSSARSSAWLAQSLRGCTHSNLTRPLQACLGRDGQGAP